MKYFLFPFIFCFQILVDKDLNEHIEVLELGSFLVGENSWMMVDVKRNNLIELMLVYH